MMKHPVNINTNTNQVLQEDVGGSGERSGEAKIPSETRPLTPLNETGSGDLSPFETEPGIFPTIGYWILRIVFYLAIILTVLVTGVYLSQLTGMYDVCEANTYVTTQCESEPYANGFLYYVKCTEESFCLLPGFWSTSYTAGWSLTKPDSNKVPDKDSFVTVDGDNEETAIKEIVEST